MKYNFELDKYKLVEENSDSQFCTVEFNVCRSGANRNRLFITKDAIKYSAESIKGKPVLAEFNAFETDFVGHGDTSDGDYYAVGFFLEEEPDLVEREDGELYLVAKAKIWKRYFENAVDIFKRKGDKTQVSMEMEALEYYDPTAYQDGEISLFSLTGVTLLGVREAIKGSDARVLSFSEIKEEYNKENTKMSDMEKFSKERKKNMEAKNVKINKTELKETPWGDIDKTELRNKVMDSKNVKTLVKSVYALVEDGWEEAPSEKLKYPIMEIDGDTAYYNRHGLASALGYAKKEGETEVVDKVEKLYDKFKIEEGKDDKQMAENTKFSQLEGREVYNEVIKRVHAKLGSHYYVEEIYSDHIEVKDMRTDEILKIPAKIKLGKDDEDISIEIDYDKMKKSGEQKQFEEDKKMEDDDSDKEDKEDVKDGEGDDEDAEEFADKNFSLDVNAYAGAMLAMLEAETAEQRKEAMTLGFTEEANIIMEKVFAIMAERDELFAYKCEQMEAEKKMEVDKVLAEIKCDLDTEKYSELQKEGYECKYEEIQAFTSKAKAFAYESVKGSKKKETGNIFMRMSANQNKSEQNVFDKIMNK